MAVKAINMIFMVEEKLQGVGVQLNFDEKKLTLLRHSECFIERR